MSYFVQTDIESLIPADWLVEGLNDSTTATTPEEIAAAAAAGFAKVQALVEAEVNGTLSARYAVPMSVDDNAGLAAFLKSLCVLIAVETIYDRRGKELPKSRIDRLEKARLRLASIAKGVDPLSPAIKPVNASGELIGEESRAYSTSLAA